jgi:MFS family permease
MARARRCSHFANAPLLPLVGQKLAIAHPVWGTAMMSSCIIAAQVIMLPIALFVGWTADTWGRKPLLLIGFGILPVRAALYTISDDATWLIAVQLLDGVGAGIFGAITPLVLADLMRGTGRYNVAQGAVAVMQGIGASTSGLVAGLIVDYFGYSAGVSRGSIRRRHRLWSAGEADARNRRIYPYWCWSCRVPT